MATFTDQEAEDAHLDWRILSAGSIALYHKLTLLDEDARWLSLRHYDVKRIDCASWTSVGGMHTSLADVLAFPDYYGRNLDALRDCMFNDVEVAKGGGLAISLAHFDGFASGPGGPLLDGIAHKLLDIFAGASSHRMLTGRRLVTLVQTDDPRLAFPALGANAAQWNEREWMNRDRGL